MLSIVVIIYNIVLTYTINNWYHPFVVSTNERVKL
jgi:hypothetical protein